MECNCEICKTNIAFDMPEEITSAYENSNLVLFCGAGISTESQAVLRSSFYSDVCAELSIETGLPFSQVMTKYCSQPNGRKKLLQKLISRFKYIHSFRSLERMATRFHNELSPLYNIKTIITTNWDRYFEDICCASPIINPKDFAYWDCCDRRVLKMHGSIDNPGSIIATSEDYEDSSSKLHSGIVGSVLKTIILTSTTVFIGFSFRDEDFAQLMSFIQSEMGEVSPHIYIVTLDKSMKDRLEYHSASVILTDGSFFLHNLKLELLKKGLVVNLESERYVTAKLDELFAIHANLASLDYRDFPSIVYCLFYQDGAIDCFERYLQTKNSGLYNQPTYIHSVASQYQDLIDKCTTNMDYSSVAYYEGYINGLCFIATEDVSLQQEFPMYYIPNAIEPLTTEDILMNGLSRSKQENDEFEMLARHILEAKGYDHTFIIQYNPF